jgi:hypothetical protein
MEVSMPLTWGRMFAERRDLIVAMYSLLCATGCSETAIVFTGIACIPAPCAAFGCSFWHPATARHIKRELIPKKVRFKSEPLASLFFTAQSITHECSIHVTTWRPISL